MDNWVFGMSSSEAEYWITCSQGWLKRVVEFVHWKRWETNLAEVSLVLQRGVKGSLDSSFWVSSSFTFDGNNSSSISIRLLVFRVWRWPVVTALNGYDAARYAVHRTLGAASDQCWQHNRGGRWHALSLLHDATLVQSNAIESAYFAVESIPVYRVTSFGLAQSNVCCQQRLAVYRGTS